jgi:hypothetical protein
LRVPQQEQGQLGVEVLLGPKVLEQQAVLGPGGVVRDASEFQERAPRHQCPVGLPRAEAEAVLWRKTKDAVLDLPPAEVAVATGASRDGSGRQIEWVEQPERRAGAAVWRLAEEGPQLGRSSEVFLPMLFMRRSLRVQRSGSS